MSKRRIVQLAMNNHGVVALASDGSLWYREPDTSFVGAVGITRAWKRIEDPFQDAARVEKETAAALKSAESSHGV